MSDKKFELSRRNALIGLGTVGLASAGAGVGTSAYFSDEESFEDNTLTAGELDLAVQADIYEYQGQANGDGESFTETQNGQSPTIKQQLSDVKPGDYSCGTFCFSIVDNPGYIWAGGELTENDENSVTEPEAEDDPNNNTVDTDGDIDGEGELADAIEVTLFYADPTFDPSTKDRPSEASFSDVIFEGTLRETLAYLQSGVPLDADPSTGSRDAFHGTAEESFDEDVCLGFAWEVPTSVENEIQTDSVEFDLAFVAYQERHNDGSQSPFVDQTFSEPQVKDRGDGSDGTTYHNVADFSALREPTVNVAIGDSTVLFQMLPTVGMADDAKMSLALDEDGSGGYDFQITWDLDDTATTPSGENFAYQAGSGPYQAVPSDIYADYDSTNNVFSVIIPKSRLTSSGNSFGLVFQTLHENASNVPNSIDGQSIDAEVPLDFSWGNSSDFLTVSL